MKVLVSAPYMQPVIDRFRSMLADAEIELVVVPVQERLDESDLLRLIPDFDGVIAGDDQFTEKVLRSAPRLKVISKWGTGIDSIDLKTCKDLGIAVRNTPNAFSDPVADTVLGYMLSFTRNLYEMDQYIKRGEWRKIPGRALRECILGVIGVGNVGKAVVRRASAFGMRVLGNDLVEMPQEFQRATEIEMVSKQYLLAESDFVSVNCDLNSTSYHLISQAEFKLMKSSAILINTARGPIVDEQALISALDRGEIRGAALDVFEKEPLPLDSSLRHRTNVLLAPHNSNSSPDAWERVHQNTIANLIEELRRRCIE